RPPTPSRPRRRPRTRARRSTSRLAHRPAGRPRRRRHRTPRRRNTPALHRPDTAKALAYFKTNAPRMRYDYFRDLGLFIGSGVVEAGCKAVIGQRLKLSGMRWNIPGATGILTL